MYLGEFGQDNYNDVNLIKAGYFDADDLEGSIYSGIVDISSNGTITVKQ